MHAKSAKYSLPNRMQHLPQVTFQNTGWRGADCLKSQEWILQGHSITRSARENMGSATLLSLLAQAQEQSI